MVSLIMPAGGCGNTDEAGDVDSKQHGSRVLSVVGGGMHLLDGWILMREVVLILAVTHGDAQMMGWGS